MKWDKQKCPKCGREVVTLYKKNKDDIPWCYWCNRKQEKSMSNLGYKEYKGCGACELCKENINCKEMRVPVSITFKKAQKADNGCRFVTVFDKNETIKGNAVIKDNQIYCASAKSNIYEEYEDFISLENVEIKRFD